MTRVPWPSAQLLTLSESECRVLLDQCVIGRVIISVNALPAAFPVNYIVVGNSIVFRTDIGTKLGAALDGVVVGFEVDDVMPSTQTGWSVLVVGISSVVSDPAKLERLGEQHFETWIGGILPHFVEISIDQISGRRVAEHHLR